MLWEWKTTTKKDTFLLSMVEYHPFQIRYSPELFGLCLGNPLPLRNAESSPWLWVKSKVRSVPGLGRPPWRRKWQPTPVFLPGKSHGQRSLVVTFHGVAESDTAEHDTASRPKGYSAPFVIHSLKWSRLFNGLFYFLINILLKYSWLTMFQVHSKVIQLYIYTYIIFKITFHYRLLQDIDYSSLCYTVKPLLPSVHFIF